MPDLDIEVTTNPSSFDQLRAVARAAERLDAVQFGVWDSPALCLDPWVALGVVSGLVTTMPIGVSVTNPVTRHVVVTANAIASLSHVAPGGVYLGIGTGDSGVFNLGGRAGTIAGLRVFLVAVRELLENGRTEIDGRTRFLSVKPRGRIPLYVAAHGRRSLELGAELADGLILGLGHSADVVEPVMNVIADVRGRVDDLVLTWNSGGVHVDEVPGAAIEKAEWLLASFAHHFSRFGLQGKFVPQRFHAGIRELGHAYDLERHGKATANQVSDYRALAEELGVRDYLLERFVIAGTRAQVTERLHALAGRGARRFSASVTDVTEIIPALELVKDLSVTRPRSSPE